MARPRPNAPPVTAATLPSSLAIAVSSFRFGFLVNLAMSEGRPAVCVFVVFQPELQVRPVHAPVIPVYLLTILISVNKYPEQHCRPYNCTVSLRLRAYPYHDALTHPLETGL
jgi:hypothetical protein